MNPLALLLQSLGPVGVAMGGITSVVTEATAAFGALGYTISSFVGAFAPGAVLAFQQSLYDFSAVIGSALLPVLNVMTTIVRGAADAILPLMTSLAPILDRIAEIFKGPLMAGVRQAVMVFTNLLPIVDYLVTVMEGWSSVMQAVQAIFSGFMNLITSWIGSFAGPIKSAAEFFRTALQNLARSAILAAASLAKLLGADSFIKGMITALGGLDKPGSATGLGAARNAQITDATSFGRTVAIAAVTAAGTPAVSKEDAWRESILQDLDALMNGRDSIMDTLAKSLAAQLSIVTAIAEFLGLKDKVKHVAPQPGPAPRRGGSTPPRRQRDAVDDWLPREEG